MSTAAIVHAMFQPCILDQVCGNGMHTKQSIAHTKNEVMSANGCFKLLCVQVHASWMQALL